MKHDNSNIVIHLTTKKLLIVILSLQLAFLGLVGLEKLGLEIPILRQTVGFIYLTFVPGFLIFKLLQINNKNAMESLLYSVGLSLSFLMLIGVLINFLYPLIGVSNPISEIPLVATISIIIPILCLICYLRDKNYSTFLPINGKSIFSPTILFLLLLPFLAIFGCYLFNFYNTNILLLILLVIISIIPVIVISKIPEEVYPLVIWATSLALLFHTSLISKYVGGADAPFEYYFSVLTITNNSWSHTLPNNINAMLSIVMLIPIFSIVSHIDPTWYIKVAYPLLFSLAPLGLYLIFKKQTTSKIALLSSIFFMFLPPFFGFMAVNTRQGIAELFLVLLMLLMVNEKIPNSKRALLSIIFMFSIVTSHYGLSYIFMSLLIISSLVFLFLRNKFIRTPNSVNVITPTSVTVYVVFALSWYMYTTNSSTFDTIVRFGNHVATTIFTEFLHPQSSSALYISITELPPSLHILRLLIFICVFFISIGVSDLLYNLKKGKTTFLSEWSLFSVASFGFLLTSILPRFSKIMGIERIFHISSIFLSPFYVVGSIIFIKHVIRPFKALNLQREEKYVKIVSLFLCLFFLFSSNFVSVAIMKDYPSPYLISLDNIEEYVKDGRVNMWKAHVYKAHIMEQDVFGARWLSISINEIEAKVWADWRSCWALLSAYGMMGPPVGTGWPYAVTHILTNKTKINEDAYIYLRCFNTREGIMLSSVRSEDWYSITAVSDLNKSNKIYTNGGSEIYYLYFP